MTRRFRLIPLALLLVVAAAQIAQAQGPRAPRVGVYNGYTIQGATTLDSLKVNWRAYPLLPPQLRDRTANGGSVLRFGPIGSCKFNLSVSGRVVARTAGESASAHAAERAARDQPVRLRVRARASPRPGGSSASRAARTCAASGRCR